MIHTHTHTFFFSGVARAIKKRLRKLWRSPPDNTALNFQPTNSATLFARTTAAALFSQVFVQRGTALRLLSLSDLYNDQALDIPPNPATASPTQSVKSVGCDEHAARAGSQSVWRRDLQRWLPACMHSVFGPTLVFYST